jgi:hypothetical protein
MQRLTLTTCISAIVLLIVTACLVVWTNEVERRECADRHNRVVQGVHSIISAWDQFPLESLVQRDSSGAPLCSWRLHGLMIAETFPERPRLDLPWNAIENLYFARQAPMYYCEQHDPYTRICALTGDGSPLGTGGRAYEGTLDADTVLVIEVVNTGIHWMEPRDIDIDELRAGLWPNSQLGDGQAEGGAFYVGFADGKAWLLKKNVPIDRVLKFATVFGAWEADRDIELAPYRVPQKRSVFSEW